MLTHTPAHTSTHQLLLPAADVLSHPADTRQSTGGEIHFGSNRSPGLTPYSAGFSSHRGTGSASRDWFFFHPQKRLDFFPHAAPWLLVK